MNLFLIICILNGEIIPLLPNRPLRSDLVRGSFQFLLYFPIDTERSPNEERGSHDRNEKPNDSSARTVRPSFETVRATFPNIDGRSDFVPSNEDHSSFHLVLKLNVVGKRQISVFGSFSDETWGKPLPAERVSNDPGTSQDRTFARSARHASSLPTPPKGRGTTWKRF